MNNPSDRPATQETVDDFDIEQVELHVRPRAAEVLTLSFPTTVIASLKQVMVKRSMSSIEALIRFYVGKGLRQDLSQLSSERMIDATAQVLTRRLGSKEAAAEAIEEIRQAVAEK